MLPSGDEAQMRVVLDWVSSFIPLATARTALLLPGESGIFFTEVSDIFGLYQGGLYGCTPESRPPGYPAWLEGAGSVGGWTRFDFGGNGHGPQAGLMAIDHYWLTGDLAAAARYVPIATLSLDFYESHYANRTADGQLIIWPTQVLEMWWCEWGDRFNASDCCVNDLPQVAAVAALARGVLQLPESSGLLTPAQRAKYAAFAAILPPLPQNASQYLAAEVRSAEQHNNEVPELYGAFPFRLLSVGRAAADKSVLLAKAVATWAALPLAQSNSGWDYGIIDAALLGLGANASAMAWERAAASTPYGYRWPGFAQRRAPRAQWRRDRAGAHPHPSRGPPRFAPAGTKTPSPPRTTTRTS